MSRTAATEAKQETTVAPEQTFTVERLRRACLELFGVSTSTFDGATCGITGEYTIDGMRNIIENWKVKEAK